MFKPYNIEEGRFLVKLARAAVRNTYVVVRLFRRHQIHHRSYSRTCTESSQR